MPLQNSDTKYTAFEANGRLYQFCRIPFGVTDGVSAFQRISDRFIAEEGLTDTFAYLDDVNMIVNDQEHHDKNLKNSWMQLLVGIVLSIETNVFFLPEK